MRSEQEMLDLILNTARDDERIRAVILNGSRANSNTPRDPFQDFDVVYIVTDVKPFRHNLTWILRFGELMILQMPDEMADPPPEDRPGFTYLMQFMDGNRIDLNLFPISRLSELTPDSLSVALLDKDACLPRFEPPSEKGYLPTPPTSKQFFDCCNEFWWVSPYVAKGLWRRQIVYAKYMTEIVRDQLLKMIVWHISVRTGFQVSTGGFGKYTHKYLEPELWEMYLKTYSDADFEQTWEALFAMGELFRRCALKVASHFGYDYPYEDDRRVSAHLLHVRTLPPDAREIY